MARLKKRKNSGDIGESVKQHKAGGDNYKFDDIDDKGDDDDKAGNDDDKAGNDDDKAGNDDDKAGNDDNKAGSDDDNKADDDDEPEWEEGLFQITNFSMGQGDCALIKCPDGKCIMVDCGSKQFEVDDDGTPIDPVIEVGQSLRGTAFLNGKDTIDALILTHADEDHYKKAKDVFEQIKYNDAVTKKDVTLSKVKIDTLYFSNHKRTLDGKKGDDFKANPVSIYDFNAKNIMTVFSINTLYCVTLRKGIGDDDAKEKILDKWTYDQEKDSLPYEVEDDQNRFDGDKVVVAKGRTAAPNNRNWGVYIIAGNVEKQDGDKSDGEGRNAASLITLITIGNEKAILCGDATLSTENYLINVIGDAIKDPDLILIPHHGSDSSCSTDNFVNHVNPTRQIKVSVKKHEYGYALPRKNTMAKYEGKLANNADEEHTTNYWEDKKYKKSNEAKAAADKVIKDWGDKSEQTNESGSIWNHSEWDEPAPNGNEDPIAVKLKQKSFLVLYRKLTTKAIRQTGLDNHQWTYFDGARK